MSNSLQRDLVHLSQAENERGVEADVVVQCPVQRRLVTQIPGEVKYMKELHLEV